MSPIEAALAELDRLWEGEDRIALRVVGSAALMLQVPYVRPTKDYDVLEVSGPDPGVRERLLALGGKASRLAERHQVYLDLVPAGLLFFPRPPAFLPIPGLSAGLRNFSLEALSVADVCVTKLKRYSPSDQGDIESMAGLGVLDPAAFLDRFRRALDANSMSAFADDYPAILARFHAVQRDWLYVDESDIGLPGWA